MKIEKVNDHQIRCTLTREDLAKRQIKISELAYGTEKARELFQEMMHQANFQFGFEAEDIPLMIEAIPINSECIVLVITKTEDPEELDTRFSQFGPSIQDESEDATDEDNDNDDSENVMNLFKRFQQGDVTSFLNGSSNDSKKLKEKTGASYTKGVSGASDFKMFVFRSVNDVMKLSAIISDSYKGSNTLYKSSSDDRYILVVYPDQTNTASFDSLCSLISEYGLEVDSISASASYLDEHNVTVIRNQALQILSKI
ncbi:MAG: adaptor protein MecA [Butyrivibrio sp.]|nr:adaptor protein MecA [Butyrivibrio sp.]